MLPRSMQSGAAFAGMPQRLAGGMYTPQTNPMLRPDQVVPQLPGRQSTMTALPMGGGVGLMPTPPAAFPHAASQPTMHIPAAMPIYQPKTPAPPSGVGPGGFQGQGNDVIRPGTAPVSPISPPAARGNGMGAPPPHVANDPVLLDAWNRIRKGGGAGHGFEPWIGPGQSGRAPSSPVDSIGGRPGGRPIPANELGIEHQFFGATPAAGGIGTGGFTWTPQPLTPTYPGAPSSAPAPAAPRGPMFHNGSPQYRNFNPKNDPGYWHYNDGSGQDLNKALGGVLIANQGGSQHLPSGMPNNLQTHQLMQAVNAGRGRSLSDTGGGGWAQSQAASSGGGGGGSNPWANAMNSANAANEARYQQGMEGHNAWRARTNELLDQLGNQQKADVNESYNTLAGKTRQNMISRGLTGTTVQDAMLTGVERERSKSLARVDEQLARERLDAEGKAFYEQMGFLERREDEGPDMGLMAQLLSRAAAGGGAGGGGGGMMIDPPSYSIPMMGMGMPMMPMMMNSGGGASIAPLPPRSKGGKLRTPYKLRSVFGKTPITYGPDGGTNAAPGSDEWFRMIMAR